MAAFGLEKGHKKILLFDDTKEMSKFFLKKWKEIAQDALKRSARFTAALSGGKTPLPFYNSLAVYGKRLPWDKTHIFLVDERFVPDNDPDSNFGMIKNTLLDNIDIPDSNIHPVHFGNTVRKAASKYEKDIRRFFKLEYGQTPQFDLIILGMGEDGHTASLFPNHEALRENRHLAIAVTSSGIKNERISLTLPVINSAKNIIFLITGRNKAHIIKEIIEKKNTNLPAFLVKPIKGELCYLMDKYAASGIKEANIHRGGGESKVFNSYQKY